MAIFRHWRGRFIAAIALVLFAWCAGAVNRELIHPRPQTAYRQIGLGESRDRLVELAGPPDGNANVTVRTFNGKSEDFQEFHYQGFYQNWTFTFDSKGNLVRKTQCVLEEYCSTVE